jgi:thiol-disulfide isomerase/thioredoxin
LFFSFLSIAFFTDVPRWVQVQIARFTLPQAGLMTAVFDDASTADFALQVEDVNGKVKPWSDWHGQPVFINFWASWCVPCMASFKSLEQLQSALPDLNMQMVNLDDRSAYQYALKSPPTFLSMPRQVSPLPPFMNPESLPAAYFLNSEGKVILKLHGAVDWSDPKVIAQLRNQMKL